MTTTKSPYLFEGQGSAIEDYMKPKQQLQNVVQAQTGNWALFDKNNQQHKAVLSQLRTLGWVVKSDKWGEVADLTRLSDFLKSDKSPIKMPLKQMKPEEVSKIIECLKSMVIKKFK